MLSIVYGDIVRTNTELLINASNGIGYMGGLLGRFIKLSGVAESIHYVDPTIEREAKVECKRRPKKLGDIFWTKSGKLGFPKGILHAVTMQKPGQKSTVGIIETCVENIVHYCRDNKIESVSIPILGAGTGQLCEESVIDIYERYLALEDTWFYVVRYEKEKN